MMWRGNLYFLAPLAALSFSLALGLALFGLWPILPFAGLEIGAVLLALYWVSYQGEARELVRIDEREVVVEKGHRYLETRERFPSAWARVRLVAPKHAWYPTRLLLGSHGRSVDLGAFLDEAEREELAEQLAARLGWAQN